jgi:AcrR family transcriptional regulator
LISIITMKAAKVSKTDLIQEAACELFWKHGFKRVSVEEVCEKAGVSKMTFYRFFTNKVELAKAVYEKVSNKGIASFKEIMLAEIPAEEKMKRILLLKQEGSNQISNEFLADFYTSKELGLKDFVEAKTTEMWHMMLADFKEAQQNGTFRKDFKPEFLLFVAQKLTELFNDPALLSLYDNPQDLVMEFANLFIYGISPVKES